MVAKIIFAVVASMFSMLIFDPYFIYGYFKNKLRKKRGEPYREYLLLFKEPCFWYFQFQSLLLTLVFTVIMIEKFSSVVLSDILIYTGICNMMFVLNAVLCVTKTDLHKIFNYINALIYRL